MKNIYIIFIIFVILYIIFRINYKEKLDNNILPSLHKNSTIPIFIISYNQYTFVKSMVEQLSKYSSNIYVIDNKSSYPPLVEYLKSIENDVKVLYMDQNYGHKVYMRDEIVKLGGDKYIITDPDLLLNPKLPQNFIDILSELSDEYKVGKIGFALDIFNNINLSISANDNKQTIVDWESQFWKNKIDNPKYELYNADIDTTFVLINSKYYTPGSYSAIRVAGDFTSVHIPWLNGYENNLLDGELKYYRSNNISTTWVN
jgi:hypothetical protein